MNMQMMKSTLYVLLTTSAWTTEAFTQQVLTPSFHRSTTIQMVSSSTSIRRRHSRKNSRIRKGNGNSSNNGSFLQSSTNQQNKQQLEFRKPLSKSSQSKLFKTYHEYLRIQSVLAESDNETPSTTLQQKANVCGYDSTQSKELTKFTKLLSEGPKARETIFLHNMGLVHFVVNNHLPQLKQQQQQQQQEQKRIKPSTSTSASSSSSVINLSRDDLIQEGSIGLAKAIDKFDPSLNYQFSTYATYWIKASVTRCIAKRDELIRVPEHVSDAIRKINKAQQQQTNTNEVQEENLEKVLAMETGLTESMVREAAVVRERRKWSRQSGGYVALEDWMMTSSSKKKQVTGLVDPQNDHDDESIMDNMERESVIQHLKDTISPFLSMREMEALSWRYGLLKDDKTSEGTLFRDYESEAERDLFGPQGILASPSVTSPTTTTTAFASSPSSSSLNTERIQNSHDTVVTASRRGRRKTTTATPPTTTLTKTGKKTATVKVIKSNNMNQGGGRWGEAMSFAEVGEQMRVSGEYGRRLCASALKKLIKAAEEGRLEPSMLF